MKKYCNINIKNGRVRIVLILLLLILFSMQVVSLGIAPAKKVIGFEPDFKKTFTGLIINNEGKNLQLEISKDDPYKLVELNVDIVKMNSNEKEKMFKYTINIPKKLDHYGEIARIRVMEKGSSTGVSSRLIVEFPIVIESSKSGDNKVVADNKQNEAVNGKNDQIENKNVSYGEIELKGGEGIKEKEVVENKSKELSVVKDKLESKSIKDDYIKMMILLIVGLFFILLLVIVFKRRINH